MPGSPRLKVALDIDGCITQYPAFFASLSRAMIQGGFASVVILTNRDPDTRDHVAEELARYGIAYDSLVITADKARYVLEEGVHVIFEDTDEYFLDLPESVCVCKVREPGNFDFEAKKWVYGPKTGRCI